MLTDHQEAKIPGELPPETASQFSETTAMISGNETDPESLIRSPDLFTACRQAYGIQKTGCATYADIIHMRVSAMVPHPGTASEPVSQTGTMYRRAGMPPFHRYRPRDLPE